MNKMLKNLHVEGIPWPFSLFYNLISKSGIFQKHYDLVAREISQKHKNGKILDIGTGPGWLLLSLKKYAPDMEIEGVDISPAMVRKAGDNISGKGYGDQIKVKIGSAGKLPYPDNYFDVIVSTGSMHHWKDIKSSFNEIYRVLKKCQNAYIYDLIKKMPRTVGEQINNEYGSFKLILLWLHSFEEPFYNTAELRDAALETQLKFEEIHYTGALCCLSLKKV